MTSTTGGLCWQKKNPVSKSVLNPLFHLQVTFTHFSGYVVGHHHKQQSGQRQQYTSLGLSVRIPLCVSHGGWELGWKWSSCCVLDTLVAMCSVVFQNTMGSSFLPKFKVSQNALGHVSSFCVSLRI